MSDNINNENLEKDDLFKRRESVNLTPENARFYDSEGGLISLELKNKDGETEIFERVVVMRSFPISNPNEFLSVREPDTKKVGRGKEIGMISDISIFDEQTVKLLSDELDRRYFTPSIIKITQVKEKFGYSYWDAETSAGHVTFVLNNPFSNIRVLEDERIIINDIDGNCFTIPDPKSLDAFSFKKIEVYI